MSGKLAENISYFARALRKAGLPIGPGTVLDAIAAVEASGFTGRDDLYWVLHAVFVSRRDQSIVFDQAFRLFWRRRALLERMMAMMVPYSPLTQGEQAQKPLNRVADALFAGVKDEQKREQPKLELDATLAVSDQEIFRKKDFEQMSAAELAAAKLAIQRLVLPFDDVAVRRLVPTTRQGRVDPRRSFRASLRNGGALIELRRRAPGTRKPPIVAICDISGSMGDYSRIFLHFLHALGRSGRTIHSFVFATELTNISRALKQTNDPDVAMMACVAQVRDWDGGTRISTTLDLFNRRWGRRVLGQGATVILITDGLERSGGDDLGRAMDRLHRSCRRLIWLNPLLRYEGFEAKAAGIRAMLPHVDEFRAAHNLASIEALCDALGRQKGNAVDPRAWLKRAA